MPGGPRRRLSCVLHPRPALARRLCRQTLPPGPPSLKDRDGGHCGGDWRTQGAWRPVLDSAGGRGGVRRTWGTVVPMVLSDVGVQVAEHPFPPRGPLGISREERLA